MIRFMSGGELPWRPTFRACDCGGLPHFCTVSNFSQFAELIWLSPSVQGEYRVTEESGSFLRAKFWHDRAEEAWSMASQMPDPEAKSTLVEIAERYDALADSMAAREAALNRRETGQPRGKDPVASDALL